MVLVRQIAHGWEIADMLSQALDMEVPFISGDATAERRKEVLDAVRDGSLSVFVATTIADEGLDIRPLSGLVLLGGGKSSVRALQRVGRVLRSYPGKATAEVIDFQDQARFLDEHSLNREQLYAAEDEWDCIDF